MMENEKNHPKLNVDPSVLSPKSDLYPKLWDPNTKKLNHNVTLKLKQIAEDFIRGFDYPLKIKDIILTGSIANFNWNQFSDIDLHLVIDTQKMPNCKLLDDYLKDKKQPPCTFSVKAERFVIGDQTIHKFRCRSLVGLGLFRLQPDLIELPPLKPGTGGRGGYGPLRQAFKGTVSTGITPAIRIFPCRLNLAELQPQGFRGSSGTSQKVSAAIPFCPTRRVF